jgi:hypothetical protein
MGEAKRRRDAGLTEPRGKPEQHGLPHGRYKYRTTRFVVEIDGRERDFEVHVTGAVYERIARIRNGKPGAPQLKRIRDKAVIKKLQETWEEEQANRRIEAKKKAEAAPQP